MTSPTPEPGSTAPTTAGTTAVIEKPTAEAESTVTGTVADNIARFMAEDNQSMMGGWTN